MRSSPATPSPPVVPPSVRRDGWGALGPPSCGRASIGVRWLSWASPLGMRWARHRYELDAARWMPSRLPHSESAFVRNCLLVETWSSRSRYLGLGATKGERHACTDCSFTIAARAGSLPRLQPKKVVEVTPLAILLPNWTATRSPKGYRLVTVRLMFPVPEDKTRLMSQEERHSFWSPFSGQVIRIQAGQDGMVDRGDDLPREHPSSGRFLPSQSRMVPDADVSRCSQGDSYILETYLWLPANVIKVSRELKRD